MSLTQTLEDAIVALIQATVTTNADVSAAPEVQDEFSRIVDKPRIFVFLHSTEGGQEKATDHLWQQELWRFQIVLRSRRLRENYGVYHLYDLVKQALLGKRITTGSGWCRLRDLRENGLKDGSFDYSVIVEVPTEIMVEYFDTTTGNGATLTQITVNEE